MSDTESKPENTPEGKPDGSPFVVRKTGEKTALIAWPQAGYDELVEQTALLESINDKMTFFTITVIVMIVIVILSALSR